MRFFDSRRKLGKSLVLATVVDTGGSTYSKAGEQMLLDEDGSFCGMLSGGCLEGDLVERAAVVLQDNASQIATYDLSPDDELWGLGVGCEGSMQIYLQPLTLANDYQPFVAIVDVINGRTAKTIDISADHSIVVSPAPALLILGAGGDAESIVKMAAELGWNCTVVDHRPAYIAKRDFGESAETFCMHADRLALELDLTFFDMVLVMSHHLISDRSYLTQLANTDVGYIGLLGPPKRRDRLLQDLASAADSLSGRLSAPAGMQLGGRGAGAIALEIIAEMQQYLERKRH